VLAGYLKLVNIPPGYERRVVNIHPALLPGFGGAGMYGHRVHEAVLASGDGESGCTVHFCDEVFDRGPIILQKRCPVLPGDTPDMLAARVFDLECRAYPEALQLLFSRVVPVGARPAEGAPVERSA
jgi:phosphoribosylglycinamide formyltransferase-1